MPNPTVRITIRWENASDLLVLVEDNGKGVSSRNVEKKTHRSRGTGIVRERLSLLPQGGNLTIENRLGFASSVKGAVSALRLNHWHEYATRSAGA